MSRKIDVGKAVLSKNDELAAHLRESFDRVGLKVINLVSSPGSGKTAWLQRTLESLQRQGRHAAALVGDLETDRDAQRLAESGAPVRQIRTQGMCHLEASMIQEHLKDWNLQGSELLFLENVGNLVCPIGFDLGQHLKVLMLSTPEGEDKPLKYPPAFAWANVVLISKMDMAEAAGFDLDFALENIKKSNPKAIVIQTSARTGQGLEDWLKLL